MKENVKEESTNSKEELLINEKKDNSTSNNNQRKIKSIGELEKYMPNLKICQALDSLDEKYETYLLSRDERNISLLKGTVLNKAYLKLSDLLNTIGLIAGMSIISIPAVYYIGYQFEFPGYVYLIIYLICLFLQFLNPAVKKQIQSIKKKDFEDFKKRINEIITNNLAFGYVGKSELSEVKEVYEFEIKNSIDITGEYDMTKPPEFFVRRRERIKYSQERKLSSLVAINICPVKIYTCDIETERKIQLYCKNIVILAKKDIGFRDIYFRNFNFLFLMSIPFLSSSLVFSCLSVDIYHIEPKKLISCEQDLDTKYYLTLCSDLKPNFILCNGEKIIFEENCVAKGDEEKLKIFNENYIKTLCIKDEERKKLIDSGFKPNTDLYKKTLGNLQIHVYVNEYYNIAVKLEYDLKGVDYTYTYGRNSFSFQSEVHINCTKEGLVKVGNKNYLYIKYLEHPIIFGDYNSVVFTVEFDGAKAVFGPDAAVGL